MFNMCMIHSKKCPNCGYAGNDLESVIEACPNCQARWDWHDDYKFCKKNKDCISVEKK